MAAEKLETRIRREQIVHAALSVVATDGLRRLSVARVARRVGVVPSALYRHFASKDEILDSVLAAVRERLIENARAAREEAPDAMGRLRALLARHVTLMAENPGIPLLVFSDEAYAGRPRRRALMFKGVRSYLDRVAEMVREGQGSGEVDLRVDPASAAVLFLGLVQPPAILAHLSGGRLDAREQAQKTWALFEKALQRG